MAGSNVTAIENLLQSPVKKEGSIVGLDETGIESLIESRVKKEGVIGGEYLAFIGILMTVTYLINAFVYSEVWIWIASIAFGWISILGYERIREIESGHYTTKIQKEILSIWVVIGGFAIPTVLLLLPIFFGLYSGKAIVSLTYLTLGIGVWLTGSVSKCNIFKFGGLSFFIAMFLSSAINSNLYQMILFLVVMVAGLIVPGIVSKINER